jgi:PAS domain S-box-containing protein
MRDHPDRNEEVETAIRHRTAQLEDLNKQLMEEIVRRTQAEEELARKNQEWARIFDAISDLIMILDDQFRILQVNKAMTNALGMTEQEMLGRYCYEFIHGQDRPPQFCPHAKLLAHDKERSAEAFEPHLGSSFDIRVFPLLVENGRVRKVVHIARDLTEKKQAEEKLLKQSEFLESILSSLTYPFFVVNADDYTIELAKGTASLGNIIEGEKCYKAIHGRTAPCPENGRTCTVKEVKRTGKPQVLQRIHYDRDGNERHVEVHAYPIESPEGRVRQVITYVLDVTEQKRAEKERDSLRGQLFQAQKLEAVGTLAGGIAHDFNNLLQIVLGYSDLLIRQKGDESPDFGYLDTIRRAAREGRDLVKGLLTFSRHAQSAKIPVDLSQRLNYLWRILRRLLPRMIEIEINLADDLRVVNANPIQIGQVLINLAINAQHAMPAGGKLMIEAQNINLDENYCRTQVDAIPGEYVMVTVSDTGQGMESEVLNRIFEPFFTTKQVGKGTGLGLSVVYGIVKDHNGHVTCSSEPGSGTTFRIYLPAGPAELRPDKTLTLEMPAFGTESILLVDDEEIVRDMVTQILAPRGYQVLIAETCDEALEIYRENGPDIKLVILDLIMPGMGGLQCLEEILRINPRATILISSGAQVDKTTRDFLELRTSGFLSKPFDAKELLRSVRRVLDKAGPFPQPVKTAGTFSTSEIDNKEVASTATFLFNEEPSPAESFVIENLPSRLKVLAIDDRKAYLSMLQAGLAQFGQTTFTAQSGAEGIKLYREKSVDVIICDLGMPELDGWQIGRKIKEICLENQTPKTPFVLLTGTQDIELSDPKAKEKMDFCGVDLILGKPLDIPDLLQAVSNLVNKS